MIGQDKEWWRGPDVGARKRGLIDEDRRTSTRSFSIDVIGDLKIMYLTTGVLADDGEGTVYLTVNGGARSDGMFSKKPIVEVKRDGNAQAGGFVRGQGQEKPDSAYLARDRADVWVDTAWVTNDGSACYAVTVTNKSGVASDFIVTALGV